MYFITYVHNSSFITCLICQCLSSKVFVTCMMIVTLGQFTFKLFSTHGGSRVAHPVKALLPECRMRPIAANRGQEFPGGGGTQLAKRYPGREGLGRLGNPWLIAHQQPLQACLCAIWNCMVLWRCSPVMAPGQACSAKKNDGWRHTFERKRVQDVLHITAME